MHCMQLELRKFSVMVGFLDFWSPARLTDKLLGRLEDHKSQHCTGVAAVQVVPGPLLLCLFLN